MNNRRGLQGPGEATRRYSSQGFNILSCPKPNAFRANHNLIARERVPKPHVLIDSCRNWQRAFPISGPEYRIDKLYVALHQTPFRDVHEEGMAQAVLAVFSRANALSY